MSDFAGKGSWRRPCTTTHEEHDLRQLYMYTNMTQEEFDREYKKLKRKGLIRRSGRVIK